MTFPVQKAKTAAMGGQLLPWQILRRRVPGLTSRVLDYYTRQRWITCYDEAGHVVEREQPFGTHEVVPGPGSGQIRYWAAADVLLLRRVVELGLIGCRPSLAFQIARGNELGVDIEIHFIGRLATTQGETIR